MAKYACGNCGVLGHNRRTCPGVALAAPVTASEPEVVPESTPAPETLTETIPAGLTTNADGSPITSHFNNGHAPMPTWIGLNGERFCYAYEMHGEWVTWPCDRVQ